jgi:hypothetical protein
MRLLIEGSWICIPLFHLSKTCCLLNSGIFLAYSSTVNIGEIFLPKRRLHFNGIHNNISHKKELFIIASVRTSNPTHLQIYRCTKAKNRGFVLVPLFHERMYAFFTTDHVCWQPQRRRLRYVNNTSAGICRDEEELVAIMTQNNSLFYGD